MGKLFDAYKKRIDEIKERKGVTLILEEVDSSDPGFIFDCERITVDIAQYSGQEEPMVVLGETIPQPVIGAALYSDGVLYCASRSGEKIGDHAEFTVLKTMTEGKHVDYKKSILFTTLEPCTKFSRKPWTESCSELIANKGIPEVHFGSLDANPNITGLGIRRLLESGVSVISYSSDNAQKAKDLNEKFFQSFTNGIDWKTIRDIELFFGDILDQEAVSAYVNENGESPSRDQWVAFYKEAVLQKGIMEDKTCSFRPSTEFAVAFLANPSNFVPGFEAVVRNCMPKSERGKGPNRQANEIRIKGSLITILGEKEFTNKDRNVFGAIQYYIGRDKLSSDPQQFAENCGLAHEQARELIINAFAHANYEKHACVTIDIYENRIEVRNSVKDETVISFLQGNPFSLPWNPTLMNYLAKVKLVEKQGQAGKMAKESNIKDLYSSLPVGGIDFVVTKIPRKG